MTNREELIKKYIRRQLSDTEKEEFDEFLKKDDQFAEDVKWTSKLTAARDIQFEQNLEAYKRQRRWRLGQYVALTAIALLIVVGIYFREDIKKWLFPTKAASIKPVVPPVVNIDTLQVQFNQEGSNKIDLKSPKDSSIKLQIPPSVRKPTKGQKTPKNKVFPKDSVFLQVNQVVNLKNLDSLDAVSRQQSERLASLAKKNGLNASDSVVFQAEGFDYFKTYLTQIRNIKNAGATKNDWRKQLFDRKEYYAALTTIRQERATTTDELTLNSLLLFGGILNASIPEGNRQEAITWLKAVIENGDYADDAAPFLIKTYIELGENEKAKELIVKFPEIKEKLPIYLQKRL